MKNTIALILLILLLKSSSCLSQDFWLEIVLPDTLTMSHSDILFDESGTVFLGTNKGLIKSYDNGQSWMTSGLNTVASLMVFAPDNAIFSITMCNTDPCLVKSNDYGDTWNVIYIWDDIPGFSSTYISSDYHIIYGAMGGIYISIDSGFTWSNTLILGDIFNDFIEKDGIYFSGSTNFLIDDHGGIYNSNDQGISWQQISLPGYGISSIAFDLDSNLLCGVDFQYNYEAFGVFRSTDGGFNWVNILPGYFVTSLAVDINGGIYAGCDSDFGPEGVQFSLDNGMTWNALNSGLHEDASIVSLAVSPDGYIFAVTVFPTKLYRSINPIVQIKEELPIEKNLSVYPNPAQDILNIKFNGKINAIAAWHVRIVNAHGITVYNEKRNPDVTEKVICSIGELNSGLYTIIIANNKETYSISFVKF